MVCQNVISITFKEKAVTVVYKNKNFNCNFCDSYPNDVHGIKKSTNITALPDKNTFKKDKNSRKMPQ